MFQIITYLIKKPRIFTPMVIQYSKGYTNKCPSLDFEPKAAASVGGVCPSKGTTESSPTGDGGTGPLKRALKPGKCRMGLIPEEWFQFFRPLTGVSGPYLFMLGLANYAASKEILVMEHEYYLGLSVLIVLYIVTTKFGSIIGQTLDKGVDEIANELEQDRLNDIAALQKQINDAKQAIWRAEGQKDLIDAKKENVQIQLEAIFRERQIMVYKTVTKRIEYHMKQHWVTTRVKHKWMVKWIMEQVHKGITPEFKKRVMESAIRDLTLIADKYQAAGGKK